MTSSQVNVTETPPMSQQDLETLAKNETDENGLILGKFKSVEDLANSYKELQGKLGQTTNEEPAAESTTESNQEETKADDTPKPETDFDAAEVYGGCSSGGMITCLLYTSDAADE